MTQGDDKDGGGRRWWPIADMRDPRLRTPAVVEQNERVVREGFWPKLQKLAGKIPFAEDLVAAYYCAVDPQTPWVVRAVLLAALAYFVLPVDMLPDILAGLGYTDDASVLAAAIRIVADHITEEHRVKARAALRKDVPQE